MGKRRDPCLDDSIDSSPGHKRHKKHKKHKHKQRRMAAEEDSDIDVDVTDDSLIEKPAIKLKLKIGGQTLGTKSFMKGGLDGEDSEESSFLETTKIEVVKQKEKDSGKKSGEDTSDEEKEWLNALEAGTLDDMGGVKKGTESKLLTARQRALIHGPSEHLMELPSGYKAPEYTDEQLKRRQQRAKKRREQAHEKREKDKKQTVERLLKKQDSKLKSSKGRGHKRSHAPGFRYINNHTAITISVPEGLNFPFQQQISQPVKNVIQCGAPGCTKNKSYSCSKTGVPLCSSLQCYKNNLQAKTTKILTVVAH